MAGAQEAGAAKPLVLTPNANMDMHGRIAAANSQLNAFTASLTAETAAPTVSALLDAKVRVAASPDPYPSRAVTAGSRYYQVHAP